MAYDDLVAWAIAEVEACLGIAREAATYIVRESLEFPARDEMECCVLSRNDRAAELISAVRATERLPGQRDWWQHHPIAMGYLRKGRPYEAVCQVAEALAVEAPDEWDPNWPAEKAAKALLRDNANEGDEYIVGNGEGERARVRVERHEGELRAVVAEHLDGPLDDAYEIAYDEATELFER